MNIDSQDNSSILSINDVRSARKAIKSSHSTPIKIKQCFYHSPNQITSSIQVNFTVYMNPLLLLDWDEQEMNRAWQANPEEVIIKPFLFPCTFFHFFLQFFQILKTRTSCRAEFTSLETERSNYSNFRRTFVFFFCLQSFTIEVKCVVFHSLPNLKPSRKQALQIRSWTIGDGIIAMVLSFSWSRLYTWTTTQGATMLTLSTTFINSNGLPRKIQKIYRERQREGWGRCG